MMKFWYLRDPIMREPISAGTMLAISAGTTLAGAGLGAAGSIMGANDTAAGAYANQRFAVQNAANTLQRGEFAKQQLKNQANETRAVATRDAALAARKKDYIVGAGRAAAAASGGNASDAGVVTQLASAERQGDYEKLMSLYTGENKARGLEYAGENALIDAHNQARTDLYDSSSAVYRARQGQKRSYFDAAGTILGAAGSLGAQYAGMRKP